MKKVKALKQDKRIGSRPVGQEFLADEKAASVWIELGLVSDPEAKIKPKRKYKKRK